jgi:hypothetical protein
MESLQQALTCFDTFKRRNCFPEHRLSLSLVSSQQDLAHLGSSIRIDGSERISEDSHKDRE